MATKKIDSPLTMEVTDAIQRLEALRTQHAELTEAIKANEAEQADIARQVQALLNPMLAISGGSSLTKAGKPRKRTFKPETIQNMRAAQSVRWAREREEKATK